MDAATTFFILFAKYVKTDIMEICVTLIVVAVKMDTHAINTTDLVIMAVCLTFSNPTVKCVKTVSTTQTVPAYVVIAKINKRVIRKVEIVF